MQLQQPQPRYHRSQQYSITALTDSSGNVTERYAYTAYGTPTITDSLGALRTSSADNNRYTYTGRELDYALSLYHFRARMYDPASGRFIGRDPIGYWDGYLLFTAYFAVDGVDPSGLSVVGNAIMGFQSNTNHELNDAVSEFDSTLTTLSHH